MVYTITKNIYGFYLVTATNRDFTKKVYKITNDYNKALSIILKGV